MLKKISFFNKKSTNSSLITKEPGQLGDQTPDKTTDFGKQKELDKKLVYSLNTKKIPSVAQLKHLFKVFDPKQKLLFKSLIALISACLIFIAITFYFRNFLPTPIIGGEYTEGLIGAPQYINPLLSQTNDVDSDISRLVFSGLLKYNKNLELAPDLAQSWQESEDKKTYTFSLKENLKWHDGQPLTADDIVFTFQSAKEPDFKSPLIKSLRGIETKKIDEKTIKFILPEPYPAFLEVLTLGILPEHIWGEIPAINANLTEYNFKPIGSGPWKFDKIAKDKLGNVKSYTIIPNENYYGPKPYLEKITFKFYTDFKTAIAALKNHSIEGISFLPKYLKSELSGQKNVKYYSFYLPQYTAVFFNQKENEFLKDKNIRMALALSIDKSKILSEALQLDGEIIDGPIFPQPTTIDSEKRLGFDQQKAEQILADAGWKKINQQEYEALIQKQKEEAAKALAEEKSKTETTNTKEEQPTTTPEQVEETAEEAPATEPKQDFYLQKDDKILEVALTTVNESENTKAAELIKEFWQNIGIKVDLQIIEAGKIGREIIKPRSYQILLFGIIVGSNPDPYPFWHSSQIQDPGLNLSMLANREVDSLLEDARKTSDIEKQKEDYQHFQDILTSEIPAIFLYHPNYSYAVDKKIKGINIDSIIIPADRFNNLEDWYIKTKRRWQGTID